MKCAAETFRFYRISVLFLSLFLPPASRSLVPLTEHHPRNCVHIILLVAAWLGTAPVYPLFLIIVYSILFYCCCFVFIVSYRYCRLCSRSYHTYTMGASVKTLFGRAACYLLQRSFCEC
uniref:Uncharacterized protein n=1 Tax=Trypanosoma vivax (strain Y486) TaxID=1055687 RepID=G0TZ03_TRYVY|nr:hypothetical protein TVY486_0705330 [Trypanosoma vivax Y486]